MRKRRAFLISLICVLCVEGCEILNVETLTEESGGNRTNEISSTSQDDDSAVAVSLEETLAQSSSDVTLVMVGDILLHEQIEQVARDSAGNYNYDFIFENMKPEIENADIAKDWSVTLSK